MTQRIPRTVQYWANNHLVSFGNYYRLIDNSNCKILLELDAFEKSFRFLLHGRVA